MPRIFVYVICYLLLFICFASPVWAQSNPLDSFIQLLLDGIAQNQIDEKMQRINDSRLPFGVQITPVTAPPETTNSSQNNTGNVQAASTQNTDPLYNAVGQYKL